MGIDVPSLQLLCCAKSIGVDFSDTMTVGRQNVLLRPDTTASILAAIGIPREQASVVFEWDFAEPLFSLLGARRVSSVDASDFERATYIHDFNQPLPAFLTNRFSVVLHGGTIEHVFNIPQAFKNCMEMVRVGGHFIQVNEANNYMGHGFWQFCPELIYRILSRENGFQIDVVLLHEHVKRGSSDNPFGSGSGRWYKVQDPAAHHCRVELCNARHTYICTIARRVSAERIFACFPQQSDYVECWNQSKGSHHRPLLPKFSMLRQIIPDPIRRMIPDPIKKLVRWGRDALKETRGPFDRPYYHRISDEDVVCGRV
jgi:hypothetical protein